MAGCFDNDNKAGIRVHGSVGEVLVVKHEDLSLDLQHPCKSWGPWWCRTCSLCAGREGQEGPGSMLASKPT